MRGVTSSAANTPADGPVPATRTATQTEMKQKAKEANQPLSAMVKPNAPSISVINPPSAPAGLVRATSSLQMPTMSRALSASKPSNEWRSFVSIEERTTLRNQLEKAYKKNCPSYDELLETVVAIEEELIFSTSNTRLDYFKAAIDWDNRLQIKRKHMSGQIGINLLMAQAQARPPSPTGNAGADGNNDDSNHQASGTKHKRDEEPSSPTENKKAKSSKS